MKLSIEQVGKRYTISSSIRRSDGVHVRIIADTHPSSSATTVSPTMEDAYLYCISSHVPIQADAPLVYATTGKLEV